MLLRYAIYEMNQNSADELLIMWGHHNHTILELFVLFSRVYKISCTNSASQRRNGGGGVLRPQAIWV